MSNKVKGEDKTLFIIRLVLWLSELDGQLSATKAKWKVGEESYEEAEKPAMRKEFGKTSSRGTALSLHSTGTDIYSRQ